MSGKSIVLALGIVATAGVVLAGCENTCQQMCNEFADIYEECGIGFGDAELRDCIETYRVPDKALRDTVCDYGMRSHESHGTILRADLVASGSSCDSDTDCMCSTLDDWRATVGGGQ